MSPGLRSRVIPVIVCEFMRKVTNSTCCVGTYLPLNKSFSKSSIGLIPVPVSVETRPLSISFSNEEHCFDRQNLIS